MQFRIKEIGLFQEGKKDIIEFNDSINFISGKSNTGKSSIGYIIDYCLGKSSKIPGRKIAEEPDIYAINLVLNGNNLLIARKQFIDGKFFGKKYIFLQKNFDESSLRDIDMNYFLENESDYFTIKDFLELEILKFFPSFPPKTRSGEKEMVRPTTRNFPAFMFQVQDTIKNQHHLFYQMDNYQKVKGIKRDFELFLGLIDNSTYDMVNRKSELTKEIKKLENSQKVYEEEIKREYFNIRGTYSRFLSHLNNTISVETIPEEDLKDIEFLNQFNISYKIDNELGVKISSLQKTVNDKSRELESLKLEYGHLKVQISNIENVSMRLKSDTSSLKNQHCPLCHSEVSNKIEKFENARKKIENEQVFLRNYNTDILKEKEKFQKKVIDTKKNELIVLIKNLNQLKSESKEFLSFEKKRELLFELKGSIKQNIEKVKEYESKIDSLDEFDALQDELDALNEKLEKIDIRKKLQEAEYLIGDFSTKMLETLEFDINDYGKPNLKFNIKDVRAYQQKDDSRINYLSDIASAENHLSFHLAVFLGLHKYIQNNDKSVLPSFIFFDQPSQVYFPTEEDLKTNTGDLKKVENIYKSIIKFVEETNSESKFANIQLIIVDHYYSEEDWYQKYLVEPRWEIEKGLGLIKE